MTSVANPPGRLFSDSAPASADHLGPYLAELERRSGELKALRSKIEACVAQDKPVNRTVQQQTTECIHDMKRLNWTMKQYNAMHRESKRIVRNSPFETKYTNSAPSMGHRSQSSSNGLIASRGLAQRPVWQSATQISAIQNRVNSRIKQGRTKLRLRERGSSPL